MPTPSFASFLAEATTHPTISLTPGKIVKLFNREQDDAPVQAKILQSTFKYNRGTGAEHTHIELQDVVSGHRFQMTLDEFYRDLVECTDIGPSGGRTLLGGVNIGMDEAKDGVKDYADRMDREQQTRMKHDPEYAAYVKARESGRTPQEVLAAIKAWGVIVAKRRAAGTIKEAKQDMTPKVGQTMRFNGKSADGKFEGSTDVKIVNPHSNADKVTHSKTGRDYEGASTHIPTATVENPRNGTHFEAFHHTLQPVKLMETTNPQTPRDGDISDRAVDHLAHETELDSFRTKQGIFKLLMCPIGWYPAGSVVRYQGKVTWLATLFAKDGTRHGQHYLTRAEAQKRFDAVQNRWVLKESLRSLKNRLLREAASDTIEVWHVTNPRFSEKINASDFPKNYTLVAHAHTNDLENAYQLTNSIDSNWIHNAWVEPTAAVKSKGGCRSTSVGDVMVRGDGKKFVVSNMGMKPLSESVGDVARDMSYRDFQDALRSRVKTQDAMLKLWHAFHEFKSDASTGSEKFEAWMRHTKLEEAYGYSSYRKGFAGPGSALRAVSGSNPRNLPCPTCKQPNKLTPADVRKSYQCDDCARMEEGPY